jgi:hypothetical protein
VESRFDYFREADNTLGIAKTDAKLAKLEGRHV